MISHRLLAALIGLWAAITWGGRIGLLTGDETVIAKTRIAVSLLVAAAAVVALLLRAAWTRPAVAVYSVVTIAVWVTSAASVLGDPGSSVPFKAVHLVLAAVSVSLAITARRVVIKRPAPEPEHPSEAQSPTGR